MKPMMAVRCATNHRREWSFGLDLGSCPRAGKSSRDWPQGLWELKVEKRGCSTWMNWRFKRIWRLWNAGGLWGYVDLMRCTSPNFSYLTHVTVLLLAALVCSINFFPPSTHTFTPSMTRWKWQKTRLSRHWTGRTVLASSWTGWTAVDCGHAILFNEPNTDTWTS